jgi:hypothetical protein
VRYWLPGLAAAVCLFLATMAGPLISLVLVLAAFGFVLDLSTKWFEGSGKTGGLGDHRQ